MRTIHLAAVAFLSLSVAASLPAATQIPAAAVDVAPFVAHRVQPKVHLLSTPDDYFGPVIGNVTLIEQRDGFVVVDSGLNAPTGVQPVIPCVRFGIPTVVPTCETFECRPTANQRMPGQPAPIMAVLSSPR